MQGPPNCDRRINIPLILTISFALSLVRYPSYPWVSLVILWLSFGYPSISLDPWYATDCRGPIIVNTPMYRRIQATDGLEHLINFLHPLPPSQLSGVHKALTPSIPAEARRGNIAPLGRKILAPQIRKKPRSARERREARSARRNKKSRFAKRKETSLPQGRKEKRASREEEEEKSLAPRERIPRPAHALAAGVGCSPAIL